MTTLAINEPAKMLTASPQTLGTVPVNKEYDIRFVRVVNLDPLLDHQVTIYDYDPSGIDYPAEAANATTTAMPAITIEKGSVGELGPFICKANRVIAAKADAPSVLNARIHGWVSDA